MKTKKSRFFEMDDTLRMIFAFYSYMSSHPNWIKESAYSKQNREIAKSILVVEEMADYYFLLQGRFYGFTVEKIDEETIGCRMEEYDNFYDLVDFHLSMKFCYHVPSKMIVEMGPVEKVKDSNEIQKKKVA